MCTQCGTTIPIWLNGTHPTNKDEEKVAMACANLHIESPGSERYCCEKHLNIVVKNCGDYFVYYLFPAHTCPVAYCAGNGRCAFCWSGAGIMEAADRQVTTVFTVQPSFHHRHWTN